MKQYQLGVIGGGNMAEAILRGIVGSNFLSHGDIIVSDPVLQRQQLLTKELSIQCTAENRTAAGSAKILLAVKPQILSGVVEEIAESVPEDSLLITIAAGVSTSCLDSLLRGKGRLVRVMPNTPMLVGEGMSAISAGPRADESDVRWVQQMFSACGKTCIVSEPAMDAVTAVSGSGPAYFFYLIEAMVSAGVAEGLDMDTASQLAAQTCAGAAKLLLETGEPPEGLQARVTSPGGTTQRAIEVMDESNVKDHLIQAIRAAAQRSRELGS